MDFVRDVLVVPMDFDETTLNNQDQISLQLLEEMDRVIRVQTTSRLSVVKVR